YARGVDQRSLTTSVYSVRSRGCVFLCFLHVLGTCVVLSLSLHDALPILARGRTVQPTEIARREKGPTTRYWDPVAGGWTFFTPGDRKSTRLNSSHGSISYAVFCLKKKKYGGKSSRPKCSDAAILLTYDPT